MDLGDVRLHTDVEADALARAFAARAFTSGADIYFRSGAYEPESRGGFRVLAHEAAHVRQQRHWSATAARELEIDPAPALEAEADRLVENIGPVAAGLAAPPPLRRGGGAEPSPGVVVMRWDAARTADNRLTDTSWSQLVQELRVPTPPARQGRREIVLRDAELTDEHRGAVEMLSDDQIHRALGLFHALRMGGGRRGARGRLISSWNAHQDDIGTPGARGPGDERYPTILHYLVELEWIAGVSMGTDYLRAIDLMPTVPIAGARIAVHPRAVYFVAAAQAAMDEAAIAAGADLDGAHYVAPANYVTEMGAIAGGAQDLLRALGGASGGVPPREHAAAAAPRVRRWIRTLSSMADVMAAQAEGRETPISGPDEHREPALQAFFRDHRSEIAALVERSGSLDEPAVLLNVLDGMSRLLDRLPGVRAPGVRVRGARARRGRGERSRPADDFLTTDLRHGAFAIDPHGTGHALGIWMDLNNGRGIQTLNFGVNELAWPFLHYLLERYGDASLAGLRPDDIDDLTPDQRLRLDALIRDSTVTAAAFNDIAAGASGPDAEGSAAAIADYEAMFPRVRGALRRALDALRALHRLRRYRRDKALGPLLLEQIERIRGTIGQLGDMSPRQAADALDAHLAALDRIRALGTEVLSAGASPPRGRESAEQRRERARAELRERQRHARVATVMSDVERPIEGPSQLGEETLEALQQIEAEARADAERLRRILEAPTPSQARALRRLRRDEGALEAAAADAGGDRSLRNHAIPFRDAAIAAEGAWQARRMRGLLELVESRAFQRWYAVAGTHGIYDQPRLMMGGIMSVRSHEGRETRFYGGHHWNIVPMEVLSGQPSGRSLDALGRRRQESYWRLHDVTNADALRRSRLDARRAYQASILRDMETRSPDTLRRIIAIMAESPGGLAALEHPEFQEALRAWSAPRGRPTLDEMMAPAREAGELTSQ